MKVNHGIGKQQHNPINMLYIDRVEDRTYLLYVLYDLDDLKKMHFH